MSLPKFTAIHGHSVPHPRFDPQDDLSPFPQYMSVAFLLDEDGNPWIYDEITGIRPLFASSKENLTPP